MLTTRQCDFSGDFDSRATDHRAASRSQNVRFINLAGSRSGRCGDSCGRAGGCRSRYHRHGGGDANRDDLVTGRRRSRRRCRGGHREYLSIGDLYLGRLILAVADSLLRHHLRLDTETGEGSRTRGA